MKLDRILIVELRNTIEYIKEKYGVELTLEEVHKIYNSQFSIFREAFENEDEIKLDYLGRFKIKLGRKEAVEMAGRLNEEGMAGKEIKKKVRAEVSRIYFTNLKTKKNENIKE